jgi:uncharacterized small protein (DUF1192 family)
LSRLDAQDFVERHEVMLRKQDGSRFWAVLAVRRIEFDGEQVHLTGIHDLTERKRVEEELSRFSITLEQRVHERTEELRRSNAELDQHNRAKSAFVSMVSHEPANSDDEHPRLCRKHARWADWAVNGEAGTRSEPRLA